MANTECGGGCRFDDTTAVYLDGTVVSHCTGCNQRLVVLPFPGSFTAKKVQGLIHLAVAEIEPGRRLAELQEAIHELEEERVLIDEAIRMGRQVSEMVWKRVREES